MYLYTNQNVGYIVGLIYGISFQRYRLIFRIQLYLPFRDVDIAMEDEIVPLGQRGNSLAKINGIACDQLTQ